MANTYADFYSMYYNEIYSDDPTDVFTLFDSIFGSGSGDYFETYWEESDDDYAAMADALASYSMDSLTTIDSYVAMEPTRMPGFDYDPDNLPGGIQQLV